MCLSRRIRSHLMPACTCLTLHLVPETKHIRAWLCNNVPVYGLKSGPLSGWKPAIVCLLRTPLSLVAKSTQDTMLWFRRFLWMKSSQENWAKVCLPSANVCCPLLCWGFSYPHALMSFLFHWTVLKHHPTLLFLFYLFIFNLFIFGFAVWLVGS